MNVIRVLTFMLLAAFCAQVVHATTCGAQIDQPSCQATPAEQHCGWTGTLCGECPSQGNIFACSSYSADCTWDGASCVRLTVFDGCTTETSELPCTAKRADGCSFTAYGRCVNCTNRAYPTCGYGGEEGFCEPAHPFSKCIPGIYCPEITDEATCLSSVGGDNAGRCLWNGASCTSCRDLSGGDCTKYPSCDEGEGCESAEASCQQVSTGSNCADGGPFVHCTWVNDAHCVSCTTYVDAATCGQDSNCTWSTEIALCIHTSGTDAHGCGGYFGNPTNCLAASGCYFNYDIGTCGNCSIITDETVCNATPQEGCYWNAGSCVPSGLQCSTLTAPTDCIGSTFKGNLCGWAPLNWSCVDCTSQNATYCNDESGIAHSGCFAGPASGGLCTSRTSYCATASTEPTCTALASDAGCAWSTSEGRCVHCSDYSQDPPAILSGFGTVETSGTTCISGASGCEWRMHYDVTAIVIGEGGEGGQIDLGGGEGGMPTIGERHFSAQEGGGEQLPSYAYCRARTVTDSCNAYNSTQCVAAAGSENCHQSGSGECFSCSRFTYPYCDNCRLESAEMQCKARLSQSCSTYTYLGEAGCLQMNNDGEPCAWESVPIEGSPKCNDCWELGTEAECQKAANHCGLDDQAVEPVCDSVWYICRNYAGTCSGTGNRQFGCFNFINTLAQSQCVWCQDAKTEEACNYWNTGGTGATNCFWDASRGDCRSVLGDDHWGCGRDDKPTCEGRAKDGCYWISDNSACYNCTVITNQEACIASDPYACYWDPATALCAAVDDAVGCAAGNGNQVTCSGLTFRGEQCKWNSGDSTCYACSQAKATDCATLAAATGAECTVIPLLGGSAPVCILPSVYCSYHATLEACVASEDIGQCGWSATLGQCVWCGGYSSSTCKSDSEYCQYSLSLSQCRAIRAVDSCTAQPGDCGTNAFETNCFVATPTSECQNCSTREATACATSSHCYFDLSSSTCRATLSNCSSSSFAECETRATDGICTPVSSPSPACISCGDLGNEADCNSNYRCLWDTVCRSRAEHCALLTLPMLCEGLAHIGCVVVEGPAKDWTGCAWVGQYATQATCEANSTTRRWHSTLGRCIHKKGDSYPACGSQTDPNACAGLQFTDDACYADGIECFSCAMLEATADCTSNPYCYIELGKCKAVGTPCVSYAVGDCAASKYTGATCQLNTATCASCEDVAPACGDFSSTCVSQSGSPSCVSQRVVCHTADSELDCLATDAAAHCGWDGTYCQWCGDVTAEADCVALSRTCFWNATESLCHRKPYHDDCTVINTESACDLKTADGCYWDGVHCYNCSVVAESECNGSGNRCYMNPYIHSCVFQGFACSASVTQVACEAATFNGAACVWNGASCQECSAAADEAACNGLDRCVFTSSSCQSIYTLCATTGSATCGTQAKFGCAPVTSTEGGNQCRECESLESQAVCDAVTDCVWNTAASKCVFSLGSDARGCAAFLDESSCHEQSGNSCHWSSAYSQCFNCSAVDTEALCDNIPGTSCTFDGSLTCRATVRCASHSGEAACLEANTFEGDERCLWTGVLCTRCDASAAHCTNNADQCVSNGSLCVSRLKDCTSRPTHEACDESSVCAWSTASSQCTWCAGIRDSTACGSTDNCTFTSGACVVTPATPAPTPVPNPVPTPAPTSAPTDAPTAAPAEDVCGSQSVASCYTVADCYVSSSLGQCTNYSHQSTLGEAVVDAAIASAEVAPTEDIVVLVYGGSALRSGASLLLVANGTQCPAADDAAWTNATAADVQFRNVRFTVPAVDSRAGLTVTPCLRLVPSAGSAAVGALSGILILVTPNPAANLQSCGFQDVYINSPFTIIFTGWHLNAGDSFAVVSDSVLCNSTAVQYNGLNSVNDFNADDGTSVGTAKITLNAAGTYRVCYQARDTAAAPLTCPQNVTVESVAPWVDPAFLSNSTATAPLIAGETVTALNSAQCKSGAVTGFTMPTGFSAGPLIHPTDMTFQFGSTENRYQYNEVCVASIDPLASEVTAGHTVAALTYDLTRLDNLDKLMIFVPISNTDPGEVQSTVTLGFNDKCPSSLPDSKLLFVFTGGSSGSVRITLGGIVAVFCTDSTNLGGSVATLTYTTGETLCPFDCKDESGTTRGSCDASTKKCNCDEFFSGVGCRTRLTCAGTGANAIVVDAPEGTLSFQHGEIPTSGTCGWLINANGANLDRSGLSGIGYQIKSADLEADCDRSYLLLREGSHTGAIVGKWCRANATSANFNIELANETTKLYIELAATAVATGFSIEYTSVALTCPGERDASGFVNATGTCHGFGNCLDIDYTTQSQLLKTSKQCICLLPHGSSTLGGSCLTCGFGYLKHTYPVCIPADVCPNNCNGRGTCTASGCACDTGSYGRGCALSVLTDLTSLAGGEFIVSRMPLDDGVGADAGQAGGVDNTLVSCELSTSGCVIDYRSRGLTFTFVKTNETTPAPATAAGRRFDVQQLADASRGDSGVTLNPLVADNAVGDYIRQLNITGTSRDASGIFTVSAWVKFTEASNGFLVAKTDAVFYGDGRQPGLERAVFDVNDRFTTVNNLRLNEDLYNVYFGVYINGRNRRVDVIAMDPNKRTSTTKEDWIVVRHFRLGSSADTLFSGDWRMLAFQFKKSTGNWDGQIYIDGKTGQTDPDFIQCFPWLPVNAKETPPAINDPLIVSNTTGAAVLWGYRLSASLDEVRMYNKDLQHLTIVQIAGDLFLDELAIDTLALLIMGIIGSVGLVAGVALFIIRRHKKREQRRQLKRMKMGLSNSIQLNNQSGQKIQLQDLGGSRDGEDVVDVSAPLNIQSPLFRRLQERGVSPTRDFSPSPDGDQEPTFLSVRDAHADDDGNPVKRDPSLVVESISGSVQETPGRRGRPSLVDIPNESFDATRSFADDFHSSPYSYRTPQNKLRRFDSEAHTVVTPREVFDELEAKDPEPVPPPGFSTMASFMHAGATRRDLADTPPPDMAAPAAHHRSHSDPQEMVLLNCEDVAEEELKTDTTAQFVSDSAASSMKQPPRVRRKRTVTIAPDDADEVSLTNASHLPSRRHSVADSEYSAVEGPGSRRGSLSEVIIEGIHQFDEEKRKSQSQSPGAAFVDGRAHHETATHSEIDSEAATRTVTPEIGGNSETKARMESFRFGANFGETVQSCYVAPVGEEEDDDYTDGTAFETDSEATPLRTADDSEEDDDDGDLKKSTSGHHDAGMAMESLANIDAEERARRQKARRTTMNRIDKELKENDKNKGRKEKAKDAKDVAQIGDEAYEAMNEAGGLQDAGQTAVAGAGASRNAGGNLASGAASSGGGGGGNSSGGGGAGSGVGSVGTALSGLLPEDLRNLGSSAVSLITDSKAFLQMMFIIRDCWQIVSLLLTGMTWPEEFTGIFGKVVSVISLGFDVALSVPFAFTFYFCAVASLLCLIVLIAVSLTEKKRSSEEIMLEKLQILKDQRDGKEVEITMNKVERVAWIALISLSTLYLPVTRNAVVAVFCHKSIQCLYDCYNEPAHWAVFWIGIVTGILVTLFAPIAFCYITVKKKKEYTEFFGPSGNHAVDNESWSKFLRADKNPYTSVYDAFELRFAFFQTFQMISKALICFLALGLAPDSTEQICCVLIVQVIFLCMIAGSSPFLLDICNFIIVFSQFYIVLALILDCFYRMNPDNLETPYSIAMNVTAFFTLVAQFVCILFKVVKPLLCK